MLDEQMLNITNHCRKAKENLETPLIPIRMAANNTTTQTENSRRW